MNCKDAQTYLQEHFVTDGLELSLDIQRHLDECPDCREVFDELTALGEMLAPMESIEMTSEESAEFMTIINRGMSETTSIKASPVGEGRIMSIVRTSLAAAAVVLVVLASASFNHQLPSSPALFDAGDEAMLSQVTSDDLAAIVDSSESGFWTTMVDDQSVSYLTDQASSLQIDDVLDDVSAEELEWLAKNYSMEM